MEATLTLRYYDTKLNIVYSLEQLRSEYYNDSFESSTSFDDWLNEMIESEVLIPIA